MDYTLMKMGDSYSYTTITQDGNDMVTETATSLTEDNKADFDAYIKRRFGAVIRKRDINCCICVDAGKITSILHFMNRSDRFDKFTYKDLEENCPISVADIATLDAAKSEVRRRTLPA